MATFTPPDVVTCLFFANHETEIHYKLIRNRDMMFLRIKKAYLGFPPGGYAITTRAPDKGLQLIQTVAENLPFGELLWVDLKVGDGGEAQLRRVRSPLRENVCEPYGDGIIIDEREITMTKVLFMDECRALFKGKEVDLKIAWDEVSARRVRYMSKGYKIMQGLDLTFDVLGHVARNGKIVGIMLECARGRPVQARDRALVGQAFAKLREHRILFRFPDAKSSILVTDDGKVRFLDPFQVNTYSHGDETAFSQDYYQRLLDNLFKTLEREGNFLVSYHEATPSLYFLGNMSPIRPLSGSCLLRVVMTLNVFRDEQGDRHVRPHRNYGNSRAQVLRVEHIQPNLQSLGRHRRLLSAPEEFSYDISDLPDLSISDSPYMPTNPRIMLDLLIYNSPHTSSNPRIMLDLSICDSPYNPAELGVSPPFHSSRVQGREIYGSAYNTVTFPRPYQGEM